MDDSETLRMINEIKDFFNLKFSEFEKRMDDKFAAMSNQREAENSKIDYRLTCLETDSKDHNNRINTLERRGADNWKHVVSSVLSWIVPFLFMAAVFFLSHGTIKI
jgi:hypothetical protein